jgi:hypothetical protein|tara:strand:- start:236 stop:427 length:192 start_codon:yes stop_codon:yes gene_type:complete
MAENTGTKTTSQTAPGNKSSGNTIDADSYRQMVTILDQLRQHTHTFTDDYTTNCQCNCSRGSL